MSLRDQVTKLLIAALLAVNIYFAAVKPATSAEGVVYERYASHTFAEMWAQPLDPSLGLVYGALARIATRAGGVSELTIRIPAILGGLLFWIGLSYFTRRFAKGWSGLILFAVIAINPWTFQAFATASGGPLAIGLLMTAASLVERNALQASLLAGLAIGSDAKVALGLLVFACVAVPFLRIGFWKWVDELLLPCLMPGLLLLSPCLLIRERPVAASMSDFGMRDVIRTLMKQPRDTTQVPVAVSPSLEPGVFFYRRRFHLDWIQIRPLNAGRTVLIVTSTDLKSDARVIQNAPGVILASRELIP